MELEAIILAGGLGTRLRSVVSDIPKAMAPVAGRPFLEYVLEYLSRQGFYRIILAVGYKKEMVKDHFGTSFQNVYLTYSDEEELLGTGGAIRRALNLVNSTLCFVLNGDTWIKLDFRTVFKTHLKHGPHITVVVHKVPDVGRYGAVEVRKDRVAKFSEKGLSGAGYINAGVYLISPSIFLGYSLPEVFSFERDFLSPNTDALLPFAFKAKGQFIDIGIPEDYERAQRMF